MKKVLWLIISAALILAALIGVGEFYFGMGTRLELDSKNFRLELLKVLWQFLLIAVLGGALGLFFKSQEREAERLASDKEREIERQQKSEEDTAKARKELEAREEELRAARREALLSTHASLIKAYHEAKAIRRLLRALALESSVGEERVVKSEYVPLMKRLIDAQLNLEYYTEFVRADKHVFSDADAIRLDLESVERYLGKIVGEFEQAWRTFGGEDYAPLSRLPKLREFIQDFVETEPFATQCRKPFARALRKIEAEANRAWGGSLTQNPAAQPDGSATG